MEHSRITIRISKSFRMAGFWNEMSTIYSILKAFSMDSSLHDVNDETFHRNVNKKRVGNIWRSPVNLGLEFLESTPKLLKSR